jgi:hypothetical protein
MFIIAPNGLVFKYSTHMTLIQTISKPIVLLFVLPKALCYYFSI